MAVLMRRAVRWRFLLLAAWIAICSVPMAMRWNPHGFMFNDWGIFQLSGRILLHRPHYDPGPGGALHLYANLPRVQIGPPAIYLSIPFDRPFGWYSVYAGVVVMGLMGLAFLYLVERLGLQLRPDVDVARLTLIGGLVMVPGWTTISALYVHLDDTLVLLCLAGAMLATARGRWWIVAMLLGVAVAAKPWAVFLVPIVFGLPRERRAITVLGVLGVAGAFWAPFVLAAPATIGSLGALHLPVSPDSPLRDLHVRYDAAAPSWVRGLQLPVAVLVGILAGVRGRWVAVPIAAIAVRVALDPQTYAYYDGGLVAAAFIWDMSRGRRWPVATLAATAIGFGPELLAHVSLEGAASLWLLGAAALVAAALFGPVPEDAAAPQEATSERHLAASTP